ncbi:DNA repair protein RecO [Candidatus Synchoanobacter obligatus]|uniref:DNA repair protein RecO C-terminal domain-containing protein n=1 Tax=Candidatus Synchoanobacter obligatus TaxID=2919597 RepID=A0ABT1L4P2_9GAMM|nr:DNA repair protein RecO C-terminal domain-containing protein [Candidatus Synchoanobacter obligatus]MCP8352135.1 DNA repair protein RecO C-terminal domain-containing protein [Candidatus Synchoanobacter obligatus]
MTPNPAYIIHERALNEKKKFVYLFNRNDGMKSITTATKKVLHYFSPYQTTQNRQRTTLHAPLSSPLILQGRSLYCGLYLNEVIYKFCYQSDPHPLLYDQYVITLDAIQSGIPIEAALRLFELRLFQATGYGIDIVHITEPYIEFNKHQGFIGKDKPSQQSIPRIKLQDMLYDFIPSQEVKLFFRNMIGTLTNNTIQSRRLYEQNIT